MKKRLFSVAFGVLLLSGLKFGLKFGVPAMVAGAGVSHAMKPGSLTAQQVVEKLRKKNEVLAWRWGEIVDHDVYFRKGTIKIMLKLKLRNNSEFKFINKVPSLKRAVHKASKKALCPILLSARDARRIKLSILAHNLRGSLQFSFYRAQCQAAGA